jgi:multidrug resistance protein MdtO
MLTAGSPFLHVMWVLANLFAVFYVISRLNFTNASLTVSVLIAVAIQAWDYPISAEVRVERTLYTLLSILIACAISALIETAFADKEMPGAVFEGIGRRIELVETFLDGVSTAKLRSSTLTIQLGRSAAKGVDDLWELLANSSYEGNSREFLATVIALTRQLVEVGSNFAESAPALSVEEQERCRVIACNLASVRSRLTRKESLEWVDLAFPSYSVHPILTEIERTAELIAESFSEEGLRIHSPTVSATPKGSNDLFSIGASRDPEHVKFAMRGMFSAFVCYLFYMSTGWIGLGSSIITCTLTARRFTGASRQRQSLRFAGFVVGAGAIGLGTEALILPRVDTIAGFALVFASVICVGSWVATSGPRIAYAGFQIVLAYSVVNLNRFTINTSLVPARDSILGVVLGVVAMWLIFDHLWAQSSSASVRNLFLKTLHEIADFNTNRAGSPPEIGEGLAVESSRINRKFEQLRDLADMYAFESFPKRSHESLVNRSIRTLLPDLRAFLIVKTGLLQHRNLAIGSTGAVLVQEVEDRGADVLRGLANAIERETPGRFPFRNAYAEELRMMVMAEGRRPQDGIHLQKYTEMRLCLSLLDLASDLERRARSNFSPTNGTANAFGDSSIGTVSAIQDTVSRVD